jgi:hypothetical protein
MVTLSPAFKRLLARVLEDVCGRLLRQSPFAVCTCPSG